MRKIDIVAYCKVLYQCVETGGKTRNISTKKFGFWAETQTRGLVCLKHVATLTNSNEREQH